MKSNNIVIICALLLTSTTIIAQETDTASQQVGSYFSFTYDNDFFNNSDRYYTQEIRLEFSFPFVKKSPISKLLLPLQNQTFQQYGIAITQDCFTPPSIRRDTIQRGERPFASVLYFSHFSSSVLSQKKQKIFTQLDMGIIGPCAGCKEMQVSIHRWLDNIQPLGWEFQVANDIILNYTLQLEKGLLLKKSIEFVGYAGFRAGTLYDDVSAGALVRVGRMNPYFENENQINRRKFQLCGFVNGKVKAVGYNATLQGGLFNQNDIYTLKADQISRIVWLGSAGIVLVYNKLGIEYTRVFITSESKGGLHHGWGHVNIKVGF